MPDPILKDLDRKKLDGIISQMVANKETDEDIQLLVEDFTGKYGQKKNDLANGSKPTSEQLLRGFVPIQDGGITKNQPENKLNTIYEKYPGLKSLGEVTLKEDPNFNSQNTGGGSIEYFSPKQKEITYGNGLKVKHPKEGTHGIVYDPNTNDEQSIMLDMLHGMKDVNTEYAKQRNILKENLVPKFKGDIDAEWNSLPKEDKVDGKESFIENWTDGVIRNLMFEGDFKKANYYDKAKELYLVSAEAKQAFNNLKKQIVGNKNPLAPPAETFEVDTQLPASTLGIGNGAQKRADKVKSTLQQPKIYDKPIRDPKDVKVSKLATGEDLGSTLTEGGDFHDNITEDLVSRDAVKPMSEPDPSWKNIGENFATNIAKEAVNIGAGLTDIARNFAAEEIPQPVYDKGKITEYGKKASWILDPLGRLSVGLHTNLDKINQHLAQNQLPDTFVGNTFSMASNIAPSIIGSLAAPETKVAEGAGLLAKVGALAFNKFTKYLAFSEGTKGYAKATEEGATPAEAALKGAEGTLEGTATGVEMAGLGWGSNVATKAIAKGIGLTGLKGIAAKELINLGTDVMAYGLVSPFVHAGLHGQLPTGKDIAGGTGISLLFRMKGTGENLIKHSELNSALKETNDLSQGIATANFVDADPQTIKAIYHSDESSADLRVKALELAKQARDEVDLDKKEKLVAQAISYTKASNIKQVADMVVDNKDGFKDLQESDLPEELKNAFIAKAEEVHKLVDPVEQEKTDLGDQVTELDNQIAQHEEIIKTSTNPVETAQSEIALEEAKKLRDETYNGLKTVIKDDAENKAAIKAQNDETDAKIKEFQVKFPDHQIDPLEDLPESVVKTFDRVEADTPTDPIAINEASDWLYGKYKQLSAMKKSDTRRLTIEQIEGMQEQLGEDITTLENFKRKYYGTEEGKDIELNERGEEIKAKPSAQVTPLSTERAEIIQEIKNQKGETVDAVQEQKSESLDVEEQAGDGKGMGEGNAKVEEVTTAITPEAGEVTKPEEVISGSPEEKGAQVEKAPIDIGLIEQEVIDKKISPVADEMVKIENELNNRGFELTDDYDEAIMIINKKTGEQVEDASEIPADLQKMVGDYEEAVQKLSKWGNIPKHLSEARERFNKGEIVPHEEIKDDQADKSSPVKDEVPEVVTEKPKAEDSEAVAKAEPVKEVRKIKPISKRISVEHAGREGARRVTGENENKLEIDGYGTVLTSQFIGRLVENGRLPKEALKNKHIQLSEEYATKLLNENSDLFPKELADKEDLTTEKEEAPVKKKSKTKSRTDKVLGNEPNSFREALLQFFLSGGKLSTEDFIRLTGFNKNSQELRRAKFFGKITDKAKGGFPADKILLEHIPEAFQKDGGMDLMSEIADMAANMHKSEMLKELERSVNGERGEMTGEEAYQYGQLTDDQRRVVDMHREGQITDAELDAVIEADRNDEVHSIVDHLNDKELTEQEVERLSKILDEFYKDDQNIDWDKIEKQVGEIGLSNLYDISNEKTGNQKTDTSGKSEAGTNDIGDKENRQGVDEKIAEAEKTVNEKEQAVKQLESQYEKLSKSLADNLKENQQSMFENKTQSLFNDKGDQSKIVADKKDELDNAKKELTKAQEDLQRVSDSKNQLEIEVKPTTEEKPIVESEPVADKKEAKSSLTAEEQQRKKELRIKLGLGNLNSLFDPTKITTKEFREYASLVLKEAVGDFKAWSKEMIDEFGDAIKEHLPGLFKELGGEEKTTLRNADVEQKRADYGFDEPAERPVQTNEETLNKARKRIESGESVYDVIDKALKREPINEVETAMLALFQGTKEAELIDANQKVEKAKDASVLDFENQQYKRNKIIDDLISAYDASEMAGNVQGRALQARKIKVLQDYSLANMLIKVRKANDNKPLTNEQVEDVTKKYNELKEVEAKLNKKLEQLQEENSKLKLREYTPKIRREVMEEARNKKRAETKATLKEERESIFDQMRKLANKSRGTLSMNPIPAEMVPLIGKLAKNYFVDGVTSIEAIVDQIHTDMKDLVDGITKRDVRDAISGYNRDTRPTKSDLQKDIDDLKQQAKLISQIEDAEAGLKKSKPEKQGQASDEVEKLRARLKDLTKDESSLAQLKTRVKKQIADTEKKLSNKDYSKKESTDIPLDEEARKLQDAYRKIKFDFDVAVAKDVLANRTKNQKYKDLAINILNIPRALMATADLSAVLRQAIVPTISHPVMASKAFVESMKQWGSEDRQNRWLADLKDSEGYQLMKDSKLYLADKSNPEIAAKEEEWQTNLAEKIPVAGKLIKASERQYVGYLNKVRVDLFTRGVDILQNSGLSAVNHPEEYKALATYINAITGRGNLGALETAAPVLNVALFSPRLMASRMQLLSNWANPRFYKNTPFEVKKMYFTDMAKFIGFGASILALSAVAGANVETDPRSPDFGKIRHGNTRWDIWGGFQQYVRYFYQIASGEKKSTASGNITPLDGTNFNKETRGTVALDLVRSKLAPIPSFMVNALTGSDMVGKPFSLGGSVTQMLTPLVWQDVYSSAKQDGWPFALTATAIPAVLGVGVQTYGANNFLQQGVDSKAIKLLLDKRAVAVEPREGDKKIYDIKTGKEREMTSAEFKKYYSVWSDHIKKDLNDNYDEYKQMAPAKFEKEFRAMKTEASKKAKESISGVTPEMLSITRKDEATGDMVTYNLDKDQVKERLDMKDRWIAKNGKEKGKEAFMEAKRKYHKSDAEADVDAEKAISKAANTAVNDEFFEKYKKFLKPQDQ